MMKAVVLLSLIACALGGLSDGHIHAAQKLQSLHSALSQLPSPRSVSLQNDPLPLCLQAYINLSTILNGTCGEVAALYRTDQKGVNVTSIVYNQCVAVDNQNHTCAQKTTYAIETFANSCSGTGLVHLTADDLAVLSLWTLAAKLPCIENDNTLCYPIFRDVANSFNTTTPNEILSEAFLDEACNPCVTLVLDTLATWGNPEDVAASAQLRLVCTKLNDQYCFPIFQAAVNSNATGLNNITSSQLNLVCDKCTTLIAFRSYWVAKYFLFNLTQAAEIEQFLGLSALYCQKDTNGDYCLPKVQNYNNSALASACEALLPSSLQQCPGSQCQQKISAFKNAVGCCYGTWFKMLQFWYNVNSTAYLAQIPVTPNELQLLSETFCKVPIGATCAKQNLKVWLYVQNLRQEWINENINFTETALIRILAFALGITENKISISSNVTYDTKTNKTTLVVTIQPSDADEAAFLTGLTNNNTFFSSAANQVQSALKGTAGSQFNQTENLNNPVTLSAYSVPDGGNAGSYVAPSFIFAILALVTSFLLWK